MNHFIPGTPEQLLCMATGVCGLLLVVWLKWQDEQQGGLEKSSTWMSYMMPCAVFLAVQVQLIAQMVMSRMGS